MFAQAVKSKWFTSAFVGLLLLFPLSLVSQAQTNFHGFSVTNPSLDLDASRIFALGMIETGNDDSGVGRAGEISRFQIHPAVWKAYSKSREYRNPQVSLEVARQHWAVLTNYFREKAAREPTDFDMYVLWNTRYGFYARNAFNPQRLPRIVQDRAQRFVNLVNRKTS